MKVKNENLVYNMPIENGVCVIAGNETKNLIEYLTNYFVRKKKNICVVLDEEGDLVKNEDVAFIYVPSTENLLDVFEMKPKTMMNSEITEFINANQDNFRSVEAIRNLSYELLTDNGMFRLKKIMQNGTAINIEYDVDDFDVSRLLQMIEINIERLTVQQQFIVLYNILLYTHRSQFCILYIDFEIDKDTIEWIENIKEENILFLLDNSSISTNLMESVDAMLFLSKYDFVNEIEFDINLIDNLSYCLNPYTLRNYAYQTEKNRAIIDEFMDDEATFLIKFSTNNIN